MFTFDTIWFGLVLKAGCHKHKFYVGAWIYVAILTLIFRVFAILNIPMI